MTQNFYQVTFAFLNALEVKIPRISKGFKMSRYLNNLLKDIFSSSETLKDLLRYLYTDSVSKSACLEKLFAAADKVTLFSVIQIQILILKRKRKLILNIII